MAPSGRLSLLIGLSMPETKAPVAARKPHRVTFHSVEREDPYHWLRADNWQEVMQKPEALPAEIRSYLEAENSWYETRFGEPTKPLQERIYKEIRGRIKEDDSGIPSPDGPWAYNSRMEEGKQYPILVRTPRDGDATVPCVLAVDCTAVTVSVSPSTSVSFATSAHSGIWTERGRLPTLVITLSATVVGASFVPSIWNVTVKVVGVPSPSFAVMVKLSPTMAPALRACVSGSPLSRW